MKKEKKAHQVKELSEILKQHDSFYLMDFTNLSVEQSVELRKILRNNSSTMRVVKNRLALRALSDKSPPALKQYFRRPTAIALALKNPVNLARIIKDFSDKNKVLAVKGGLLEGQLFSSERFPEIVKLSSRENLLGKIGYFMALPLIEFYQTWQAPLTQLGRMLSQLKTKK